MSRSDNEAAKLNKTAYFSVMILFRTGKCVSIAVKNSLLGVISVMFIAVVNKNNEIEIKFHHMEGI